MRSRTRSSALVARSKAARLVMPHRKLSFRSRVLAAVGLQQHGCAQNRAPTAHAPRGLLLQVQLVGLAAPARARAKSLGMSSAGLLRVRGDGGHRYFARAHHAVHLYDTRRHALVEVIRH